MARSPHDQLAATARTHLQRGDADEAAHVAERVLAERPRHAAALAVLGTARMLRGRMDEGLTALKSAARIAPKDPQIQCDLAAAQYGLGDYDAALSAYDAALRADRRHESALIGKAEVLERRGRGDEAMRLLDRARPADGDESVRAAALRVRLLDADPDVDADTVAAAARAVADRPGCPWRHRRAMLFLLGRAADRAGDTDAAMDLLTEANALGRSPFDRETVGRGLAEIRRVFAPNRFESMPASTTATRGPLFIVGLPRSGSTLLETMLDAHPKIHGGGELPHLATVLGRVRELAGVTYPDGWSRLAAGDLDRLAQGYLARLRTTAGDDPAVELVVDKSLDNVLHLGAIARLLPEAAIVHVSRDRVDAGLSAWMQNLIPTLHPWSTSLADCGWYVRAIEAHAAHWHAALGDRVLSVRYEDLVADPERHLRRVLDHAGLAFDPACLQSHRRRRDVATASYAQVAEPVHNRAVGRADRYRAHLGPLLEALGPEPGPPRPA